MYRYGQILVTRQFNLSWMGDKEKIIEIVDTQFSNYIKQDRRLLNQNMDFYDEKHIGIGTGENELFKSIDELREAYLTTSDKLQMEAIDREIIQVEVRDDTAWLGMILKLKQIEEDLEFERNLRFTGVFVRVNGEWKYHQTHWSVPEIGLEEGKGKPTVRGFKAKINELLNDFNLMETDDRRKAEIREYLEKAKTIADSITV